MEKLLERARRDVDADPVLGARRRRVDRHGRADAAPAAPRCRRKPRSGDDHARQARPRTSATPLAKAFSSSARTCATTTTTAWVKNHPDDPKAEELYKAAQAGSAVLEAAPPGSARRSWRSCAPRRAAKAAGKAALEREKSCPCWTMSPSAMGSIARCRGRGLHVDDELEHLHHRRSRRRAPPDSQPPRTARRQARGTARKEMPTLREEPPRRCSPRGRRAPRARPLAGGGAGCAPGLVGPAGCRRSTARARSIQSPRSCPAGWRGRRQRVP